MSFYKDKVSIKIRAVHVLLSTGQVQNSPKLMRKP